MEQLLRTLSVTLLLTSFLAVESRSLRRAVLAYMVQALVMVAVIATFATLHPRLWVWVATALVTKFALISWMLLRATRAGEDREVQPWLGPWVSMLLIGTLALAGYSLVHRYAPVLAPTPLAAEEPYRTNMAVSLTLLGIGLYATLTRRDALKVVLGVCLIENGAHLSLVSFAPGMQETVLIGIVTDVVVAVYLLL
ncbi:MAG TPA: NADH-quinone oxidoreductase subunit K, partial [Candidatus Limnocylindrales bacterium]